MAGDAERISELKRAYADVILNVAKDSAAQILAAERRALQSQRSLSLAKEDSLALLLRLKSIMDSKIKEAETVNLSQARKIQELEVQLSEAKDTIHHLNSELKKVSSKFESEKSHQTECLEEQNTCGCIISHKDDCQESRHTSHSAPCSQVGTICSPNSDYNLAASSQRTVASRSFFVKNTSQDDPLKNLIAFNGSAGNPDLVSITLKNKETERYRNGCTQRTSACEQNLCTGTEPPAQNHDQFSNANHEDVTCEDGLAERRRARDSTLAGEAVIQVKKPLKSEEVVRQGNICENGHTVKFSRQRSLRKQVIRNFVMKTSSCSTYHDAEDHEQSDISNSKIVNQNSMSRSCAKQGENSEDTFSRLAQDSREDHKTSKDRNMKLNKFSDHVISGISNTNRVMTRRTVKQCNVSSENHCVGSTTSISLNSSQENIKKESGMMSTFDMKYSALLVGATKNDAISTRLEKEPMLRTPDHKMAEDFSTSESKVYHEIVGVPSANHGSKDEEPCRSSGHPAEAGNERIVKYTFKRTRKRGSPYSKNEAVPSEEKNMLKKKVDKENALLPLKPNVVTESTRDSRRLAQVARQLISLSEKRWW